MRAAGRELVERVLCGTGAPARARARRAEGALVLAYHDIVPEGAAPAGDRSLHLPQRDFARQLDRLMETHEVVALPEILRPAPGRGRPRAAITFDDAYEGALVAGVAELERRRLPATIFVAPAFVPGGSFWWDALAGTDGLAPDLRVRALSTLAGKDDRVRWQAAALGIVPRTLPPHARAGTEALLAAATAAGITLASHSWSHPVLPALPPEALREELTRPLTWLRERFQGVLPWLSYPYGLTAPHVARAAAAAGYVAGLRVDGGWLRPSVPDPFDLPRLNVPAAVSLRGFELRTAGLLAGR